MSETKPISRKAVAIAAAAAATLVLSGASAQAAAMLTGSLTADNHFKAYISTSDSVLGTEIASGDNWQATYSLSTPLSGGPLYLHVITQDDGRPDMFIGSFSLSGGYLFANGASSLNTDVSHWRANDAPDFTSWTAPTGTPQSFGANGASPWGNVSGVASNADFIWSQPDSTNWADFSTTLTAPAGVPEPAAWAMLLMGVLGVGATLRGRRDAARTSAVTATR